MSLTQSTKQVDKSKIEKTGLIAIVATVAFALSIIPNITSAMNPEAAPFPFLVSSSLGFWLLVVFYVIAFLDHPP